MDFEVVIFLADWNSFFSTNHDIGRTKFADGVSFSLLHMSHPQRKFISLFQFLILIHCPLRKAPNKQMGK